MGSVRVDQVTASGLVVQDVDRTLSDRDKLSLLTQWLPGSEVRRLGSQRYVHFHGQALLYRQVTHLGGKWDGYKKRIQIPGPWLKAHAALAGEGLRPRFMGIYHYGDVTIFVSFDPATYLTRNANESAAHVATNDLYQAQTIGLFERTDKNGNRLTSVRADHLADHLGGELERQPDPHIEVFRSFNRRVFTHRWVHVLEAVQLMRDAGWRGEFQSEWAGSYLEHQLDEHLRSLPPPPTVELVHEKGRHGLDFDLRFHAAGQVAFLGDLKASSESSSGAPGNDAASLDAAIRRHGRFWYIVYEHETIRARDQSDVATVAWNEWRWAAGHRPRSGKAFDPLSYRSRLKAEVRFSRMVILEVNPANRRLVLGAFNQGRQQSGAARAPKVLIKKADIDNFVVYRGQGGGSG